QPAAPERRDTRELHEVATSLRDAARRCLKALEAIRRLGQESGSIAPECLALVDVLDVARGAARDVGSRFPHVAIAVLAPRGGAAARAPVRGGEETLRRIVENMLVNACQGDGERGARNVHALVTEDARVGAVAIQIVDDGAGFPTHLLDQPIAAFLTTKRGG